MSDRFSRRDALEVKKGLHIRAGWLVVLYLAIIMAPLVLSAVLVGPPRGFRDEAASAAGMLGLVLLLIVFTLSGRFKWLSRRIAIDTLMQVHRLIGQTALAAALVHPFLYRAARSPAQPGDTTRVLTITHDFGTLWTGILAFVLLPTLVLLAQTRGAPNYRYEAWRWLHGLSALVIGGLLLHHVLYAGRYAAHPVIAAFWIVLSSVVAFSLLWIYVAIPLGQARRPWRVVDIRKAAERIWKVEIAPSGGGGLDYNAGQFAWLNLGSSPFAHRENPFSIASAPSSGPNLAFLIKELGDSTSRIGAVPPGTIAYVDGPHGALTVAGQRAEGVGLIAGGIGIAPLIGILQDLALSGDERPCTLIYADKSPAQIVERGALEMLAAAPNVAVEIVFDRPPAGWAGEVGHVDKALLARHFSPAALDTWLFVLCGPPPMLDAVETALGALGVGPERILSERFDYD